MVSVVTGSMMSDSMSADLWTSALCTSDVWTCGYLCPVANLWIPLTYVPLTRGGTSRASSRDPPCSCCPTEMSAGMCDRLDIAPGNARRIMDMTFPHP